jgi:class 3 adenylate cyclase
MRHFIDKNMAFTVLIIIMSATGALSESTLKAEEHPKYFVKIDSINDAFVMDSNWLYKKGDNQAWSSLNYDDSEWDTLATILNVKEIDKDVFDSKGWFRLHLEIDSSLFGKPFALLMNQYGASEIFLSGKKITTFGILKSDSSEEKRYNPKLLPTIIRFTDSSHQVLAVRYHHEKAFSFSKRYYQHNAGFRLSLSDPGLAITRVDYFIISGNFFLSLIMIFAILGFIHLLFFLFYKKKISNLYYSIFLFIFSSLVYAGKLQNEISLNPDVHTRVAFFVSLGLPFFFITLQGFIYSLFYKKFPVLLWISGILGILISIMYFFNLDISNYFLLGFAILIPIELIRVLILAIIKKMDGAWILGTGVILFVVFFIGILLLSIIMGGNINISGTGPLQILLLFLIVLAILSTPLSMSIYLARDIAKTNFNLEKQLEQVKLLSAKTIEQEREKKRILEGQKEKLEILVKERTRELEVEKEKTEELLLNTLPLKVVNDLKENGKTNPESFDDVTVYFSDIVGFTKLSAELAPDILIHELNDIFTAFDDIMVRHKCERIKTIGDAYLAVCGMPEKRKDHAKKMINAALEIRKFLENRNASSDIEWKIRIGIHSGRVVGGIVGVRKYIYDVFGDTINTTSRMESNSEPMQINVSETTYDLVKDNFQFIKRKPMNIKGKGLSNMYFLNIDEN